MVSEAPCKQAETTVPNSPLFCELSALAVKGPCVCLGWFQAVPLGEQAGRREHVQPLRGPVPEPLWGGTVWEHVQEASDTLLASV